LFGIIARPWRSPARAARDFPGSKGGTSDGTGSTVTSDYVICRAFIIKPSGGVGFGRRPLHDPPQLARLVVGGLPGAGQEFVVAAWRALRDELRFVPRLVIDRTEI
jgi:hypothetical protein